MLAASIFHYGEYTVRAGQGLPGRARRADAALMTPIQRTPHGAWLDEVTFDGDGLVPVIAQDGASGRVLMFAWANRERWRKPRPPGRRSTGRVRAGRLWRKGEESGHTQRVTEIRLDCDGDAVLYAVEQAGGIACHTGRESCFFRRLGDGNWQTVDPVLQDPDLIYRK